MYHSITPRSDAPNLRTGYAIAVTSVGFMIFGIYATFFSAFILETGWKVSRCRSVYAFFTNSKIGSGRRGIRQPLQIFHYTPSSNYCVLRDRELGWMAILSKFLK